MSLMAQVDRARSTLQEANNVLSGARGIFPPLRPPQTLVEISPELNSEVVTGMGEALWDMGSDLWDTVTNPLGSVGDALEGVQELIDDPIGTAQEVWEDFTEPYVEDWENGREGEAIGRGLVELGANFIPGYNVLRWLNRFDDANSDDGPEAPEVPPSESGSSGGNELPEGEPPSSDSDGPIDDPPGGDPPAAGSDESDDESDGSEPEDTPSDDDGSNNDDSDPDKDDGANNTEIAPGSVDDLLEGSTPLGDAKSIRVEKPGGFDRANEEFDQFTRGVPVNDQYPKPGLRTATLPDGTTVSVRPDSSEGPATLQVNPPMGKPYKIRYTD